MAIFPSKFQPQNNSISMKSPLSAHVISIQKSVPSALQKHPHSTFFTVCFPRYRHKSIIEHRPQLQKVPLPKQPQTTGRAFQQSMSSLQQNWLKTRKKNLFTQLIATSTRHMQSLCENRETKKKQVSAQAVQQMKKSSRKKGKNLKTSRKNVERKQSKKAPDAGSTRRSHSESSFFFESLFLKAIDDRPPGIFYAKQDRGRCFSVTIGEDQVTLEPAPPAASIKEAILCYEPSSSAKVTMISFAGFNWSSPWLFWGSPGGGHCWNPVRSAGSCPKSCGSTSLSGQRFRFFLIRTLRNPWSSLRWSLAIASFTHERLNDRFSRERYHLNPCNLFLRLILTGWTPRLILATDLLLIFTRSSRFLTKDSQSLWTLQINFFSLPKKSQINEKLNHS